MGGIHDDRVAPPIVERRMCFGETQTACHSKLEPALAIRVRASVTASRDVIAEGQDHGVFDRLSAAGIAYPADNRAAACSGVLRGRELRAREKQPRDPDDR
jgi:hypothetical protein